MNHKHAIIGIATLAIVTAIAALRQNSQAHPVPEPQLSSSTDEAAFLATQAQRELWMEQVREARVQAALQGIEPGLAGFHLIRPSDDPLSGPEFGDLGCTGNVYCWDYPHMRYPTLEYNRLKWPGTTTSIVPTPPVFCELSLDRLFSNKLATLSIESDGESLKRVVATFLPRSIAALTFMLEPKHISSPGLVIDWFGISRMPQHEHTEMRTVLVSDNLAYLPFVVQDLLAQGPGPTSIVIANGLSEQEATGLVTKFAK